jgi:ketosteroid isomerase-like protein
MEKKNGFNILFFVFIMILIALFISCAKNNQKQSAGILLQTDAGFSAMSAKEGMFKAFLHYMAEDGVILRNNSFPSKGRSSLMKYFSGKSDSGFILTWEPLYEKISESGDMGYTYGIYTSTEKSNGIKSGGTYITVWQKQSDGSWKFVLDTGTSGLPEKE